MNLGKRIQSTARYGLLGIFIDDAAVPRRGGVGPTGGKEERVAKLVPGHGTLRTHLRLACRVAGHCRHIDRGSRGRVSVCAGRARCCHGVASRCCALFGSALRPNGTQPTPVGNEGPASPSSLEVASRLLRLRRIAVEQKACVTARRSGSLLLLLLASSSTFGPDRSPKALGRLPARCCAAALARFFSTPGTQRGHYVLKGLIAQAAKTEQRIQPTHQGGPIRQIAE